MANTEVRVLVSTAPAGVAHDLARLLVGEGWAACVNLLPGVRSVYRWQGEVRYEPETVLWIKTTAARAEGLVERLRSVHPYEVPEVLTLTPEGGAGDYLEWVEAAVSEPPRGPAAG
jgi:periplasmic divalent cation tolerance protein